ncbi:LINE-1 retrotransposable element ORF1 protein [Dissostichus eleginoides]|uniref:LINE-1 retrotransposable element ORF1 protein n=1 Tax=Dissostichus eleginoides TaxID=100907 RepID=A0AAD9CKX7_DISEL|nr:LINE-1 retrotransposable element ORF1 protein [Dissostichus eleginoides]
MPNTKKTPKTVVNATQQHLVFKANASPKPANVSPDISVLNSAATEPTNTAILELLQKLSEDQTKHFTDLRKELSETRRAVVAVEEKLADVLTRITSAEARLDMLEDTEDQRRNSPPALASEVETLNAKLVEYEDRDRRVNLRIYGFPEHSEEKDALSFLKTALPDILQTDFPGGLDLERAHRSRLASDTRLCSPYTGGAKHRFDDPKKAMQCIRTL